MATRKDAAKAEQMRISQIGDFKQRMGGTIELPSGFMIRWRNPGGLRAFLTNGSIPNSLMNIVESALKSGKGVDEGMTKDVMKQLQDNPDMLSDLMKMYDTVALKSFIEPKLYPVPDEAMVEAWNAAHPDDPVDDPEDLRYEDRLYVDEIPDDDKAYLFQIISGGVKDLETFRQEQQIDVDALVRVSGTVSDPVESDGVDAG